MNAIKTHKHLRRKVSYWGLSGISFIILATVFTTGAFLLTFTGFSKFNLTIYLIALLGIYTTLMLVKSDLIENYYLNKIKLPTKITTNARERYK